MKLAHSAIITACAAGIAGALAPSAGAIPPPPISAFRHFSGTYTSAAQCNTYREQISDFMLVKDRGMISIGTCHKVALSNWSYDTATYVAGDGIVYYAGDKPVTWQMFTHRSAVYKDAATCNYYRKAVTDRAKKAGGWANDPVACFNMTPRIPGQPARAAQWTYGYVDYYAPRATSSGDKVRSVYNMNDRPALSPLFAG